MKSNWDLLKQRSAYHTSIDAQIELAKHWLSNIVL